jgi:hypothetical protein
MAISESNLIMKEIVMAQYRREITYENAIRTFLILQQVTLECFDENPSQNSPLQVETNLQTMEERKVNLEE